MKRLVFFTVLAVVFCFAGFYIAAKNMSAVSVSPTMAYNEESPKNIGYREKEALALDFISRKMMGDNGEIFSVIRPDGGDRETLSESVGLLMEYTLLRDRRDLFDLEFKFLKDNLLVGNKFIKWKTGKDISCNAAIDDLRIVRALLDAHEKWGDTGYLDTAGFIQDEIFRRQTDENNRLCEYYDWKSRTRKDKIPLCYLDLYSMYRLEQFNRDWWKVIDNGFVTLSKGRIGPDSPFYYKYYDYSSGSYSFDEEYRKTKGINLTYTLYTVIHLAEMNEDTGVFAGWLKKEMEKGRLYAWYDPIALKPVNETESTAVYALAAVYAKKAGETELCHMLLERMLEFMVDDKNSPYYGGFGNAETGEFYSFDNLTALYALALAGS